ncbi:MAG: ATP-binding protein [Desulfobacterales bacterium]
MRAECRRLEGLLRQREQQLSELERQLEQAQKMETLGTLVAGVAHEINNPIGLILYNLPLLRKTWADLLPLLREESRRDAERRFGGLTAAFLEQRMPQLIADMELAAQRVVRIVGELKRFSRQSDPAEREPLDVNAAVNNALRLCQSTFSRAGVRLQLELASELPAIEANLQNLEQIVVNLLVNAVQAIDHDHGEVSVRTEFSLRDGCVQVSVADNGRGVAAEIAERIFLPFVTDKQAQGGTGLGLSVSERLARAHGGSIDFENRPGGGAVFRLKLPTPMQKKAPRILVVDDDPLVRHILLEALAMPRRYLLEEAVNGIEALIRLGTWRPALVLLDVLMPEMDGVEVCRHIRAEPALAGMKVILTTGFPGHPKLAELARLGFTHVLPKPFDIPALLGKVRELLEE